MKRFAVIAVIIIVLGLLYERYCTSLPWGCQESTYEDDYLCDDHMDAN